MNSNRSPAELSALPIQSLRTIAAGYGLPLKRDMTVADMAALISAHEQGPAHRVTIVTDDQSRPAPGWARIEVHKDPAPGASNSDVFVSVNGYSVLIKRGVKVDVPIKILRGGLMDAKAEVMREAPNETDPEKRHYWEYVYSYPFTVYDINDGPDPRDTYEKTVNKRMRLKRKFKQENGYWPKPEELRTYQASQKKD